jgi:SAM-dependent methyltransferase
MQILSLANMDYVDQEFWDESYDTKINPVKPSDVIKLLIEEYIPKSKNNEEAFEIGCFPGRYLQVFGKLDYKLSGIDLTPNTQLLENWLIANKFNVGEIIKGDIFKLNNSKKYAVVSSFGFIEHFENFANVIRMHADMVEENGYLIITVPNFARGLQYFLHKTLDKKNLLRHNLDAMNPNKWLKELSDFEILFKGYFSYFNFWAIDDQQNQFKKSLIKFISRTAFISSRILPKNNKYFAPHAGIIAKKKSI